MVDVEGSSEELEDVGSEVGSSELGAGSVEEDSSVPLERLSEEGASLEAVSELDEAGSELGWSEEPEETGCSEESLAEGISEEKSSVEEGMKEGSSEETLSVVDGALDSTEAGEEQLKRNRRSIPSGNSLRDAFGITGIIKDVCAFSYVLLVLV